MSTRRTVIDSGDFAESFSITLQPTTLPAGRNFQSQRFFCANHLDRAFLLWLTVDSWAAHSWWTAIKPRRSVLDAPRMDAAPALGSKRKLPLLDSCGPHEASEILTKTGHEADNSKSQTRNPGAEQLSHPDFVAVKGCYGENTTRIPASAAGGSARPTPKRPRLAEGTYADESASQPAAGSCSLSTSDAHMPGECT
jgi:hypothetical protein